MTRSLGEDLCIELSDPCIPAGVRIAISLHWEEGATLWRCPRMSAGKGWFGRGTQDMVIEWWLVDARGDLIEVFFEQ